MEYRAQQPEGKQKEIGDRSRAVVLLCFVRPTDVLQISVGSDAGLQIVVSDVFQYSRHAFLFEIDGLYGGGASSDNVSVLVAPDPRRLEKDAALPSRYPQRGFVDGIALRYPAQTASVPVHHDNVRGAVGKRLGTDELAGFRIQIQIFRVNIPEKESR